MFRSSWKLSLFFVIACLLLPILFIAWPAAADGRRQNATPTPTPTSAVPVLRRGTPAFGAFLETRSDDAIPTSPAFGGQSPIEEPETPTSTSEPATRRSSGSSNSGLSPGASRPSGSNGSFCSAPALGFFILGLIGLYDRRLFRRRDSKS